MVEVFKTNVLLQEDAMQIIDSLEKKMMNIKINFDLEDCDKILRIEGTNKSKNKTIKSYLKQIGYYCEVLE